MIPPRYTADAPGTAVIAAPSRPPVSDSAVARVCPRSPSAFTTWAASSPGGCTGPSWPAARGRDRITAGHVTAGHVTAGHVTAGHVPAGHVTAGHVTVLDAPGRARACGAAGRPGPRSRRRCPGSPPRPPP